MRQTVHPRPLFPLAVALIFGLILGDRFPGPAGIGAWMAPAGWLAAGLWVRFKPNGAGPVLLTLFVLLGHQLIQPWRVPQLPPHHIAHWIDAGQVTVSGIVRTVLAPARFGIRFVVDCDTVNTRQGTFSVTGRIRVFVKNANLSPIPGAPVRFQAVLRPVHGYQNPRGFDYRRYLAMAGIWVLAKASGETFCRLPAKGPAPWAERLYGLRQQVIGQIRQAVGDGPAGAVLGALVVGDRSRIAPDQREAFNRAGVGHLLAISGLHIGLVAGGTFFLFKWVLSWLPCLLWRAWARRGAALLAVVPVAGYGLMAGMSPSTQRAVIMVSVGLVAVLAQRDIDLANTLAAAALAIVLISPTAVFAVSFQLSFAAVLAIACGLSCLPVSWQKGHGMLWTILLGCFWVSLLAMAGTLPLAMIYFNQVSLVGLGANMILVPLVGWGVVPLGLVSAVGGQVYAPAGIVGFQVAASLARAAIDWIGFFSDLPYAYFNTFPPTVLEVVLVYGLGGVGLSLIRQQGIRPQNRPTGAGFRFSFLTWALAALVLLGALDAVYWLHRRFWHRDLRVTVLDVGQGSSSLVEFPGGDTMLIDGGGFSDNAIFDVGKRLVGPLLRAKRIFALDTVVLSHPNADHLNGLIHIVSEFDIGRVWTNNESAATTGYQEFVRIMASRGLAPADFASLERCCRIGGARVEILYPPATFDFRKRGPGKNDPNDNSLVMRIEKDGIAVLFPGDITCRAEAELVRTWGARLQSEVLVVPHHGSRRSSSFPFLDSVRPSLSVISAGWRNRFGFPHEEVLQRLGPRGPVLRTDRDGAVSLSVADGRLQVGTEAEERGRAYSQGAAPIR